jgi:hypothetical protein
MNLHPLKLMIDYTTNEFESHSQAACLFLSIEATKAAALSIIIGQQRNDFVVQ